MVLSHVVPHSFADGALRERGGREEVVRRREREKKKEREREREREAERRGEGVREGCVCV